MSHDRNELGGPHRVKRVLDAMENRGGGVPGFRRAHARGVSFRGRFEATPEAAALTTAEHLQGASIETVVRFSNGGVSPYMPDRKSARIGNTLGLAVRFELPSGGYSASAALSLKAFAARTPDDFLALIEAQRPALPGGLPNPLRLAAFLARHPQALRGVLSAATLKPTLSFATTRFNGMHAFYAVDARAARRAFRFRWMPLAGIATMAREDDAVLPPQYLISELALRVEREPVAWDLVFQLGETGDPTDDVTKLWPEDRPLVAAGRLTVDRLHEDQDLVDDYVFDPVNVPPGIEPSADPLLHFRSHAYTESHRRRAGETRPAIKPG
jgi:catalase